MTPRALGGSQADFARQLAQRNRAERPQKKFRSAAPKGARIADGYVDRTAEREGEAEDDRAERLKALEESLKKEEIDQATFEKLRFEIAGGDLESTHLVKGLDFKLLKRIREGEDVYGEKNAETEAEGSAEPEEDVDDAFDQLEKQEVEVVEKDRPAKKKGEISTVTLAPGKKRTRDQILAELKASREAAKKAQEPSLGDRFRKIGATQKAGSRIERDSKGREVLIIVDEDGHEKRKVRKTQGQANPDPKDELPMPDKNVAPLGMEVPEQYRKKDEPEEDEDMDIFEGVGDDYDPLAGIGGSDSDSGDEDETTTAEARPQRPSESPAEDDLSRGDPMPPPPKPKAALKPNYFAGSKTGLVSQEEHKAPSMDDPAIQAAIKRAAALKKTEEHDDDDDDDDEEGREAAREKRAREERLKKMLASADRDDQDLDMGFGTSRYEDEEDLDDSKVKLSNWGQDDDGEGQGGGGGKRKRGPKKRKGDGNSAADVLRVMESRKASS